MNTKKELLKMTIQELEKESRIYWNYIQVVDGLIKFKK